MAVGAGARRSWSAEDVPGEGGGRCREFIAAGETYQANLTQAFAAAVVARRGRGCRWRSGRRRCTRRCGPGAPATMGALLAGARGARDRRVGGVEFAGDAGGGRARGGRRDVARSWPIKGTRPREGEIRGATRRRRRRCWPATKDLAEHVMIVDLVRSDLGRLAVPGDGAGAATAVADAAADGAPPGVGGALHAGAGLAAGGAAGGGVPGREHHRGAEEADGRDHRRDRGTRRAGCTAGRSSC
jgi:hypothetical protein